MRKTLDLIYSDLSVYFLSENISNVLVKTLDGVFPFSSEKVNLLDFEP